MSYRDIDLEWNAAPFISDVYSTERFSNPAQIKPLHCQMQMFQLRIMSDWAILRWVLCEQTLGKV